MSFSLKTTTNPQNAADFIFLSISDRLKSGKRVLFFLTGGSSIAVAIKVAELLGDDSHKNLIENLTVMLTDERYGPAGHQDSNWRELLDKGFSLPKAKIIPILTGDDRVATTQKFDANLRREFKAAEYKIALFGIGQDGHTAGILPESGVVYSQDLAFGYEAPAFYRITLTPKAIEKLDEVVVWVQGENKWNALKNLEKNIDIIKQPAQILKNVPLLTIFSDYKKIS